MQPAVPSAVPFSSLTTTKLLIGDSNMMISEEALYANVYFIYGCRHSIFFADGSHSEFTCPPLLLFLLPVHA